MQPPHSPPHTARHPPRTSVCINTPPLLASTRPPTILLVRTNSRRCRSLRLPHRLVLRFPILHRSSKSSLCRLHDCCVFPEQALASSSGSSPLLTLVWRWRCMCEGTLTDARMLARSCKLHVQTDEHHLGSVCLCVESVDVSQV